MKDYIEERAVEIAGYIVETKATVRQAAKKFGISKSTVHKDVAERLLHINPGLARRAGLNADHKISVFMEPGKLKYECLCYYPACSG